MAQSSRLFSKEKGMSIVEKYESSIKCKYCALYNEDIHMCRFYNNPSHICTSFQLDEYETVITLASKRENGTPARRGDGSYMVSLSDTPKLKKKLEREFNRMYLVGEWIPALLYLLAFCGVVWLLWPLISDILEIVEALGDLLH